MSQTLAKELIAEGTVIAHYRVIEPVGAGEVSRKHSNSQSSCCLLWYNPDSNCATTGLEGEIPCPKIHLMRCLLKSISFR